MSSFVSENRCARKSFLDFRKQKARKKDGEEVFGEIRQGSGKECLEG